MTMLSLQIQMEKSKSQAITTSSLSNASIKIVVGMSSLINPFFLELSEKALDLSTTAGPMGPYVEIGLVLVSDRSDRTKDDGT